MLVKNGKIVEDTFTAVADGDPLPDGPLLVSLKRFQAESPALLARGAPLGVRLESADTPEILGEDLRSLALVVLHVNHFRDGRAFSWARLLRTRLGYRGEVRISGHVLLDQIAFYARVGADAFELPQSQTAEAVRAAFTEISNVYQPSVDGRPTIRDLRAARFVKTTRAPS